MQFSSVQSLSHVRLFATPWIAARQASVSITTSHSPPRPASIEWATPSSHLILCRPLLLLPQTLPASESSPMSQLFAWGSQSTGASALSSFLPKIPSENAVLGCNLKHDRIISVHFQGKPFNIMVIQVYVPTRNAEESEVEQFYEHLQDLLELTPKKSVLSSP